MKNDTYRHRQHMLMNLDGLHLKVGMILADRIDWTKNARNFKNQDDLLRWVWRQGKGYGVKQQDMYTSTTYLIGKGYFTVDNKPEGLTLSRTLPGVKA